MKPRRAVLALVCLLPLLAARARADDWSVARGDFREDIRAEDWKVRRAAFLPLLDWDGVNAFEEVLDATTKEKNAAVILEGIKTLAAFRTPEAQAALLAALERARGERANVLLMALAEQKGPSGVEELIALLHGKEAQSAALAALALGGKRAPQALPHLLDELDAKEWQVASAAARAIHAMAWSDWTAPDMQKGEVKQPKMPDWFDGAKVRDALIGALSAAQGAARGDIILALEHVTKQTLGDNPEAWALFAQGKEVPPAILRKQVHPPYLMGVPVWGQRIVVVMDANVLTDRAHPFPQRERLQELCTVPGGRDLAWFKIRTVKNFNDAWVTRFLEDLPTKDTRFELVFSGVKLRDVFGKLQPSNGGTQRAAVEAIEKSGVENGNDVLAAMTYALDLSGKKDAVAWKKGPDVVCCVYSSVPWQAEVTDAEVVGATIGLKARQRLVKIHAIGVHEFAYGMMQLFAGQSGGAYVALTR